MPRPPRRPGGWRRCIDIDPAKFAAKVAAAGSKAFVEGVTLRQTDPVIDRNGAAIAKVKGAITVPALQVLGPTRTWAAPILGSVGEATAEQVAASKGVLEAGDSVGSSGLQFRYDARLRGTPGLAVHAVKRGADGSALEKRELFAEVSTEGEPLKITLDPKAQSAAEAALAKQTDHPTALVAVRVSTGEMLAAAVGPGADGSTLALAGKNAPGSTFKIVSSLALVRKGDTADTKLPCTPALTVNGRRFSNYTGYPKDKLGDIPMQTALAYSCNTAFISQHEKVSQDDLTKAAQSLGMGEKLDLPFTGFLGSVPTTDNVVEHAASFIGQGRVEASPLTMAVVVASVMKGQTVRPRLIADDQSLPGARDAARPDRGRRAAPGDAGRGERGVRQGAQAARRGVRQDRHRRVRHEEPARHPRVDGRRPRRHRDRGLQRGRRQRRDRLRALHHQLPQGLRPPLTPSKGHFRPGLDGRDGPRVSRREVACSSVVQAPSLPIRRWGSGLR